MIYPHSKEVILHIANEFEIDGTAILHREIPSGLINRTYEISCRAGSNEDFSASKRYILQSINSSVFSQPEKVMENIFFITKHLSEQKGETQELELIGRKDGTRWFKDNDGSIWRCYVYLEGTESITKIDSADKAYLAGAAVGQFQARLIDLPAEKLHTTIPDFHNTPLYYEKLLAAAREDKLRRADHIKEELEVIDSEKALIPLLFQANLPLRITHNDTKLSNILFPKNSSRKPILIDLDTVMPGLSLHDYGDLVRSAVSSTDESETDVSKIHCRSEIYTAIREGYLSETRAFLTDQELSLLPFAPKIITLELAIRFLSDYLLGDTYFRTSYAEENLDRARNQLALFHSLD